MARLDKIVELNEPAYFETLQLVEVVAKEGKKMDVLERLVDVSGEKTKAVVGRVAEAPQTEVLQKNGIGWCSFVASMTQGVCTFDYFLTFKILD
jgi:hypothetical protein